MSNLGEIRGVKLNLSKDQTVKLAEGRRCAPSFGYLFISFLAENSRNNDLLSIAR